MARRYEVYKCEVCGNIVWVLHGGDGALVCCGEEMKLMVPQSAEMALEKHVPILEKIEGGYRVTVGSTLHPMTEEHYIEWIALTTNKHTLFQFLEPNQEPVAEFLVDEEPLFLYEYCNLHGLWNNDLTGFKAKRDGQPTEAAAPVEEAAAEAPADFDQTKYLCTACGYIYDPVEGDPDGGIAAGTSFEDLPEDWVCPLCGVGKDMFEVYEG